MMGERGEAKILDFGLAKTFTTGAHAGDTTVTALTAPATVLGTLAYMAPEQTLGKPLDVRSDLYSLGVVLFELATGRRPFEAEQSFALASAILHQTPPSPRKFAPKLSRALEAVILKCLAKEPAERYPSATGVDPRSQGRRTGGARRAAAGRRADVRRLRGGDRRNARAAVRRRRHPQPRLRRRPHSFAGGATARESLERSGADVLRRRHDGRAHHDALTGRRFQGDLTRLGDALSRLEQVGAPDRARAGHPGGDRRLGDARRRSGADQRATGGSASRAQPVGADLRARPGGCLEAPERGGADRGPADSRAGLARCARAADGGQASRPGRARGVPERDDSKRIRTVGPPTSRRWTISSRRSRSTLATRSRTQVCRTPTPGSRASGCRPRRP